jgi:N-acetylneuraminic acid mutarotase
MHVVRKIASLLMMGAVTLLVSCGGSSGSVGTTTYPPPTASFTFVINSLSVVFNGLASKDADGSPPTYGWSFGDGATASISQPTHAYTAAGSYIVTLFVTDDFGNSASRQQTVTVTGGSATGLEPWTWVAGANTADSEGAYITESTPSAANAPSSRQSAISWTDALGQFWLFGGSGYDSAGNIGALNDLWRFNPASGQWTWVNGRNIAGSPGIYGTQGVTAGTNSPGARSGSVSWTDASGNFWLFGGNGIDYKNTAGNLNDLWMINSTTGQETWIAGSKIADTAAVYGVQGVASASNTPAPRQYAVSWTDNNGMLWLFGGETFIAGATTASFLNDLWMFNPSTKQWTWVSGSPTAPNVKGTYGNIGVGSTNNAPGARVSAQGWTDASGNLWLFGGSGYDSSGTGGVLNDMWSYNPTSKIWTWVIGSNLAGTTGAAGVYGTEGTAGPLNTPSGRLGSIGWVQSGTLWLFGGGGVDSSGVGASSDGGGVLNDLWNFNPTTGQWTWVGGASAEGGQGVYATLGVSSPYNTPGARMWSTGWADTSGKLWLFGGSGVDSAGTFGSLNDLWNVKPQQ